MSDQKDIKNILENLRAYFQFGPKGLDMIANDLKAYPIENIKRMAREYASSSKTFPSLCEMLSTLRSYNNPQPRRPNKSGNRKNESIEISKLLKEIRDSL